MDQWIDIRIFVIFVFFAAITGIPTHSVGHYKKKKQKNNNSIIQGKNKNNSTNIF